MRFIPACAGNSRSPILTARRMAAAGSSPRVRGTHADQIRRPVGQRFIPACAGNSRSGPGRPATSAVHPRVCGELQTEMPDIHKFQRFIPACAGNSGLRPRHADPPRRSSPRVRGTRCASTPQSRCRSVHPRVCGELTDGLTDTFQFGGSSPRVRGTPRKRGPRTPSPPVHPRVCGELRGVAGRQQIAAGSSPRVRGTPHRAPRQTRSYRFIPACAGNSTLHGELTTVKPVHPRVCGELDYPDPAGLGEAGSSPRVRGTPRPGRPARHPARFIPACAGNSLRQTLEFVTVAGSSPRVRGTLFRSCAAGRPRRFIPACAGNSSTDSSGHRCGPGSSPRVRGTLRRDAKPGRLKRFIPACAGNSAGSSASRRRRPVHPRVCGELLKAAKAKTGEAGSSPRVRGTLSLPLVDELIRRFIPACAGNSQNSQSAAFSSSGSSPRVRGTRQTGQRCRRVGRFIPACAGNSGRRYNGTCVTTVHPRVCGELDYPDPAGLGEAGSSPRVRGTQHPRRVARRRRRFIPACAGNSKASWTFGRTPPVHPRVCGELPIRLPNAVRVIGSSPRVRGTRRLGLAAARPRRFIPACAGNSPRRPAASAMVTGHPRVCGELGNDGRPSHPRRRFIPACAGNSHRAESALRQWPVHPRVCGELGLDASPPPFLGGSSPRVRGTHDGGRAQRRIQRFIPACAGNSAPRSGAPPRYPVHPRVCGELLIACCWAFFRCGSSPRVRGTHQQAALNSIAGRFIPACAGNSRSYSACRARRPVHPRVCGELRAWPIVLNAAVGSSPRVRGTLQMLRAIVRRRRFIPACAGNSRRGAGGRRG